MKMQNELRASRSGTVVRVGATTGSTVEVGDVLVVLGGDP
jgi:biotin carboxyl carrier protein